MTIKTKRNKYNRAIAFFIDAERMERMEELRKRFEYSYSEQTRRGLDLFYNFIVEQNGKTKKTPK